MTANPKDEVNLMVTMFMERVKTLTARQVATETAIALGASWIIAVSAQISVSLPFGIVPFSVLPHAVMLLAATLGWKRGFAAVVAYLLQGAMGAPIFAQGGFGLAHLLGPRGGYQLSFLPVSVAVGLLFEMGARRNVLTMLGSFMFGSAIILFTGWSWLSLYIGPEAAWKMGVYPFLLTNLFKNLAVISILPMVDRLSRRLPQ